MKIFVDGALGSETAALNKPYLSKTVNGTDNYGMLLYTQEELNRIVSDNEISFICVIFQNIDHELLTITLKKMF